MLYMCDDIHFIILLIDVVEVMFQKQVHQSVTSIRCALLFTQSVSLEATLS